MKRAILSLSGGMDSTSLLLHLIGEGYEVRCYSFLYGQKHRVELERAKTNIEYLRGKGYAIQHQVVDLTSAFSGSTSSLVSGSIPIPEGHYAEENMKSTVVENRNAIFAAILYGKALAWANQINQKVFICLGIHRGDHAVYPDCRRESRDALEEAFRISNWGSENVEYYTPFIDIDKYNILVHSEAVCFAERIDFDMIFKNTNTCYQPDNQGRSCGHCGSCVERVEAFIGLDHIDPVEYVDSWEVVTEHVKRTLQIP